VLVECALVWIRCHMAAPLWWPHVGCSVRHTVMLVNVTTSPSATTTTVVLVSADMHRTNIRAFE
jgi:hypothetical protein